MIISTQLRKRCMLFIAGLVLAAASRPALAAIVFNVVNPPTNGVFAATRSTADFVAATENPARAVVNGAHASMRVLGSQLTFSANLNGFAGDNFIASTGVGPQSISNFGSIGVQIIGTAGEAVGTPVSVTLLSGYSGPGNVTITQIVNQFARPVNATSTISGLKVGDTFDLWSMLNGNDAVNATLVNTLTVTGAVAEAPTLLDHFKCYEAEGRHVNVQVTLEDQFGHEPQVLVGLPRFFCNPVDKNDEGIINDSAHLTCYRIRGSETQRTVSIQNQFGEQSLRTQEPRLLCVPSEKISVIPHP